MDLELPGMQGLDGRQHLTPTSACRDTGATLPGFADDVDGERRPAGPAWDFGADEFRLLTARYSIINLPKRAFRSEREEEECLAFIRQRLSTSGTFEGISR